MRTLRETICRSRVVPAVAALLVSATAQAQTAAPEAGAAPPDWQSACAAEGCQLSRGLTDNTSGQQVLSFAVVLPAGGDNARLVAVVPLGIDLASGVAVGGGRDVRTLPVSTCVPQGCIAETAVTGVNLDLIASQSDLNFTVSPYGGGEPVTLTLPLDGLTNALAKARATIDEQAARNADK